MRSLPLSLLLATLVFLLAPFTAQAETGEPAQIPEASAAYLRGDYAQALRLWQDACDAGNPRGCFHAAVVHRDGDRVDSALR